MPYDDEKANRAIRFVSNLKLTGDFHGRPFVLMPYMEEILRNVYGTLNENGTRLYRDIYLEVAKKNAKSELGAGLALLSLYNTQEPNGEIYGAAGNREQASIIFNRAVEMIRQSKALEKRVRIKDSTKTIVNKETNSFYKVLSAEYTGKSGFSPTVVLFDELHEQPNRRLFDILTRGVGLARKQPLRYVITTAGDDPDRTSIAWEIHEKAVNILKAREEGDPERDDPTWYIKIFSYDGDDIFNEENWYKANPGLGTTINIEDFRTLAKQAKLHPADERTFRWLNLNQWLTSKLTAWLPLELWDQTQGADTMRQDLINKGKELDCFIGVDLSSTTDLTGLCVIFPPQPGLEKWQCLFDAFIPADNMQERIKRDRVPYDKWLADGYIHATPGNVIDFAYIKAQILSYANLWNVVEVGSDPALATWLFQQLDEAGIKAEAIPQYYQHQTEPMNLIEMLMKNNQLEHERHPVARWNFGNASIHKNGSGMIKLVKESRGSSTVRTKRIDLIAAWVTGMARAKFFEGAASVYNQRGLLSL
jgi:phage terminase large subunit-like protein